MREVKKRVFEKLRKAGKVIFSLENSMPTEDSNSVAEQLVNLKSQLKKLADKISMIVGASSLHFHFQDNIFAWLVSLIQSIDSKSSIAEIEFT